VKSIFFILALLVFLYACQEDRPDVLSTTIAVGQMPNVVKDNMGNFHVVYGNGDSVMYSSSSDHGKTFTPPALIWILPKLAASHTRGPQIATSASGVTIAACTQNGDIFSFVQDNTGKWKQGSKINDRDTVAKENLIALAGDGQSIFSVWLDLRDKHNKIYGAKSTDGGTTWSKNLMIYASPDSTVCECCKPSVQVKGNNVYVMFRNWVNGNRDLYLIQSTDGGTTFGQAQKLGTGSWVLNGCPMDGGGIAINNNNGNPETVWNRKGVIYACKQGEEEKQLGKGRNCTIESVNGKNVYAWVEDGEVVVLEPQGVKRNLGKGQLPVIKAITNDHILCIWEHDKQIYKTILQL